MVTTLSENATEHKVLGFIDHAENHEKYQNQRERAEICADFEQGKQWSEEQYNRYKEVGVEPVVINRCLTTIKSLDGLYVENQQDIVCVPRKGGAETAARVISEIIKHSQDTGGFEGAAANAFRKGNIQTAGYIGIDIDKTKTANGQLVFQSYGFFDIMIDPDCQDYDIDKYETGAKYVVVRKWIDKENLAAIYDSLPVSDTTGSGTLGGYNAMEAYIDAVQERSNFYQETEKTYRLPVYTVWWKEYAKGLLVIDKETGQTKIITEKIEQFRKKAKNSERFDFEPASAVILHKSVVINGKLAEDTPRPFGEEIDFFPLARYVPIFREDYERGILDDATPINFEENLRRTQVNRLLIVTANTGWMANSAHDPKALQELKQYGSAPGLVVDKSKFGGGLEKIKPNTIPDDFLLARQSSQDINEITGLNAINRGHDEGTRSEPGIVLEMRRKQGITANSGLFDNFKKTLEILGNKVLAILGATDVYTEQEIRAITDESHLIDPSMMQKAHAILQEKIGTTLNPPQPLPPVSGEMLRQLPLERMQEAFETIQTGIKGAELYAKEYPGLKEQLDGAVHELAIRMLLNDLYTSEITQYGVKIVLSPTTPTARLNQFQMLMAIQDKYGMIPPETLLKYSDIPDKDEIINQIRQASMMQQQAARSQRPPTKSVEPMNKEQVA